MADFVDIVFDGPPDAESGRFVEVENSQGKSIKYGEWIERPDGYWALRIAQQGAGEGWKLVPVDPTNEMLINGAAATRDFYSENGPYPRTKAMWRVMLAASPTPPFVSTEEERDKEAISEALAFLNRIEGHGYGGEAEFENARRGLQVASPI